jgi:Na+-transporting NADH:ubiquinone oxidoreductase subunit A
MEVIKRIETRRGANLNLNGIAEKILDKTLSVTTYGLRPDDFFGTTPKLCLKEGSSVLAGTPVFYSKKNPDIKIVSPVSGTIKKILRGPKRKIENIIIESSKKTRISYTSS